MQEAISLFSENVSLYQHFPKNRIRLDFHVHTTRRGSWRRKTLPLPLLRGSPPHPPPPQKGKTGGGFRHRGCAECYCIGRRGRPSSEREEAIMLPHRAGSQRMARGGVSSRPDAWAHPGGHRRKMCGGAAWPAGVLGQGWACGRITQDRKMQREGLRKR